MNTTRGIRRLYKEPLLHFLLIGAGLFILFGWRGNTASLPGGQSGLASTKIVVTQSEIDQMVGTFTRTWQRPPTEEEQKNLIEDLIRNEIYYREAVAAGLERDDNVIKRRLRQKMEFILEDITAQTEPTDEELLAYMKKHPESYLIDPYFAFRQVYINADRGASAEAAAQQILAQLREGSDPESVGDPILLEPEIRLSPLWDIKKQFGEEFSRNLLELKSGRWEGPVRSGFGLHLVFVTKRVGGHLPELKEVQETVKRDWMFDQQKELKDAAYAKIRERYDVVVETANAVVKPAAMTTRGGAQ